MPVRPILAARAAPVALLLPLLAGCGPDRNAFAPACPQPSFVQALSDVTRYKPGRSGQDITDVVLQGRMLALNGSCEAGSKNTLASTIRVSVEMLRGPAMTDRQAIVPVFVAVTDGDVIRDKQVYPVQVVFPPNMDRVTLTSPPIEMALPVTPTKSGASYGIIAGFQLSPEELAANRRRMGGR